MKKLIYSIVAISVLLFSQRVNAQITLEKTFEGFVSRGGLFSPVIDYYVSVITATNEVKLYNDDYSLYKTIRVTPPTNYSFFQAVLFSKDIVTTDNKVTFGVIFYSSTAAQNLLFNLKFYDENGTMIKDLGYAPAFNNYSVHVISDNKYRLSITRSLTTSPITYETDIYALPGTPTGLRSAQVEKVSLPYPNPANTVITLPYQLKEAETSVMHIYNISGQLIELKQIDFMFNNILLNVSNYAKGIYFYKVNGEINRFIVE